MQRALKDKQNSLQEQVYRLSRDGNLKDKKEELEVKNTNNKDCIG